MTHFYGAISFYRDRIAIKEKGQMGLLRVFESVRGNEIIIAVLNPEIIVDHLINPMPAFVRDEYSNCLMILV